MDGADAALSVEDYAGKYASVGDCMFVSCAEPAVACVSEYDVSVTECYNVAPDVERVEVDSSCYGPDDGVATLDDVHG